MNWFIHHLQHRILKVGKAPVRGSPALPGHHLSTKICRFYQERLAIPVGWNPVLKTEYSESENILVWLSISLPRQDILLEFEKCEKFPVSRNCPQKCSCCWNLQFLKDLGGFVSAKETEPECGGFSTYHLFLPPQNDEVVAGLVGDEVCAAVRAHPTWAAPAGEITNEPGSNCIFWEGRRGGREKTEISSRVSHVQCQKKATLAGFCTQARQAGEKQKPRAWWVFYETPPVPWVPTGAQGCLGRWMGSKSRCTQEIRLG